MTAVVSVTLPVGWRPAPYLIVFTHRTCSYHLPAVTSVMTHVSTCFNTRWWAAAPVLLWKSALSSMFPSSHVSSDISSPSCVSCLLSLIHGFVMVTCVRADGALAPTEEILKTDSPYAVCSFSRCSKVIWLFNWDMNGKQLTCALSASTESCSRHAERIEILHGNVCTHLCRGWVCVFWPVVTPCWSSGWFPCGRLARWVFLCASLRASHMCSSGSVSLFRQRFTSWHNKVQPNLTPYTQRPPH